MNYFEFYKIPIAFFLEEKALKKQFYKLSKQYHPDFYTLESEEKQAEVLELSTLNNEAYKTLSNFDKRMKYILELKGALAEEGKNKIPQLFLMEMMDINEALMELEFDFEEEAFKKTKAEVAAKETALLNEIEPVLRAFDSNPEKFNQNLNQIKGHYLKKRYLLRLQENLAKFNH